MLATLGEAPSGEGWAFEFKWDGARAVIESGSARTYVWSRHRNNFSSHFPEIVASVPAALGGRQAILDGEIVVLDAAGRPSFSRLQRRLRIPKPSPQVLRAMPATFYAFDILALDGQDTTSLTYVERRALLDGLALSDTSVQAPPYWTDVDGQVMLDIAREHGLEGIVAKTPYLDLPRWSSLPRLVKKTPLRKATSVVVCGWDPGPRGGLRALVLGAHNPAGDLCYIGHVGTGFSAKDRRILRVQLEAIEQPTPPFTQPLAAEAGGSSMRWVSAVYVGDIEYREFTDHLRHPSWKGLRDIPASTVEWPGDH
ncbi:ATP-dependent DNA ligase [Williamsia sp. D3]|uniref:ATP-dependent DNA ligase n=1 Tax=Williamsia sp. D3 TaxID=1313067 RepID=UPI001F35D58F|nr:ATP-dependent DNA ligase [Williamsia sp. D3]